MRAFLVFVVILAGILAAAAYHYRVQWSVVQPTPPPPSARQPPPIADTAPQMPPSLDQEARDYVDTVSASEPAPLPIDAADHFVRRDQVISLPDDKVVEALSPSQLFARKDLSDETPITLMRLVEQVDYLSPEQLLAHAGGDLDATITVLDHDRVVQTTVRAALETFATAPGLPIPLVRNVEYPEQTTRAEIRADETLEPGAPLRVVTQPYHSASATVAELMTGVENARPDSVYYVRTVRDSDKYGIWGIVHDGLISNFARGVALGRGEKINTYQVEIPRDADERLPDRSSSFLGKLIHQKTIESYVYNHRQRRMGQNPDHISPGQEIVIITFTADELVTIYKHFVSSGG